MVGRGAAYADWDQDGDLDFVLTANGQATRLVRNDQSLGNHWLRFRLTGTKSNRSAIGARVTLKTGDTNLIRTVMPTRSYLSQCELPVTFGLAGNTTVDEVKIEWPSGQVQMLSVDKVDQVIEVVEP
jgi:hypothetical protein